MAPETSEFHLVNEVTPGRDPMQPGDISVFASAPSAEQEYEPWYVDETYLLLRQDGKRCVFTPDDPRTRIIESADPTNHADLLRRLLIHHLQQVERAIHARKRISHIGWTSFDQLPTDMLFRLAVLLG